MHIWTGYSTAFTWQLRISSGRYTKYTPVSTFQNRVFISQFFLSCLLLLCCWFDSINILCFNVLRHKYLYLSLLIKIKTKNYQVTNLGRPPPHPKLISWSTKSVDFNVIPVLVFHLWKNLNVSRYFSKFLSKMFIMLKKISYIYNDRKSYR